MVGRRVLEIYGLAPGGLLANGLAFTTLFAVVPIALVTLGVAGLLVKDPEVQQQLATALSSLVPPLQDLIQNALVSMAQGAAVTSLIGVAGLIWTVSQFYVTLDVAFSRIFTDRPERDVVATNGSGFVWVAGLIGVVVALIVGGALATAAEALLPTTSTWLTAFGRIVSSPPMVALVTVLVVLGVYQLVPPRRPPLRAAVPPGRRRRPGDLPARSAIPVRGAADRGDGRAGRAARHGVHRARVAVVLIPGVAVRRRLGTCARRPRPRRDGLVSPGECRNGGRTERSRTATGRS